MAGSGLPVIPLRDVASGLFYARGEARLQDSLDLFVKQAMRAAYSTTDPEDPHNKELARRQRAIDDRAQRVLQLRADLAALDAPSTPAEIGQVTTGINYPPVSSVDYN